MANENKNIKELVADYSDPTVELEILSFAKMASDTVKNSASGSDIERESSDLVDPVDEIEEATQATDERLSAHKSKINRIERASSSERVSRVLIGTVDNLTLRFPLFKKSLTIGRTKDNDIQINAAYVSRRHAVIQTENGVTRIIDWGSKNGVQVNSASVSERFLCHGDTIIIGNVGFLYEERKKRDSQ